MKIRLQVATIVVLLLAIKAFSDGVTVMNTGFEMKAEEKQKIENWIASLGDSERSTIRISFWKQGWGKLETNQSILKQPLCLAGKEYQWGLGTHADSTIVMHSSKPIKSFRSLVGVDCNKDSRDRSTAKLVFSVWSGDKRLAESQPLDITSSPECLNVPLNGATELVLKVKTQNTLHLAHADWAKAEVTTVDGETIKIGTQEMMLADNVLPISFKYNGVHSEACFRQWGISHTQNDGEDVVTHRYVSSDSETGFECTLELQVYKKFPACLWNVYFKNTGHADTPILEQVNTLDLFWPAEMQKTLYRSHGAFHYENGAVDAEAFRDDFMLVKDDLEHTPEISMGGVGGRSSVDWMPYFNFAGNDEGLIFGIGWTGQWHSTIKSNVEAVHFQAGMEKIHTVLHPGEIIRQPSILMLYWRGEDPIRGHNLLRRFMTDEILPHYDNKPVQTPAACGTWGGMPTADHLKRIANIREQKLPYDYYWVDAGWYGPDEEVGADVFTSNWADYVGMWRFNAVIHPQGLKPISDAAHKAGMKFVLWFEPERAVYGTPMTLKHPEWFLDESGQKRGMKGRNMLLNLGNPEASSYCVELIAGMIRDQGIDCYRQDFNFSPLKYWQANDTPYRVGMTEIRYIEGLYTYLDELRRRFPNLLIDNCASGGRRLDFEMMRRSIPLWISDMQCFPYCHGERTQQQVYGLSLWIPQFSSGTKDKHPGDTYHFRSTMAAGIVAHLFSNVSVPIDPKFPYQWLRDRLNEYHRAKVYFGGDFYPLMKQSDSFEDWSIFQYDRPDLGGGILEFFRKKESPIEKVCPQLRGLDRLAMYEIEDADSGHTVKVSGQELMEKGWPVEIATRRDSRLFFYRSINAVK